MNSFNIYKNKVASRYLPIEASQIGLKIIKATIIWLLKNTMDTSHF